MKSLFSLAILLLVLFITPGSSSFNETEQKAAAAAAAWPRYPPCVSGSCTDFACCAQGRKFRWPELVGKNGQQAKAIVEKENPLITVVIIPPGRVGFADFCCNRVYIVLNNKGNVVNVPTIG